MTTRNINRKNPERAGHNHQEIQPQALLAAANAEGFMANDEYNLADPIVSCKALNS